MSGQPILVVGAGQAGATFALALRRHGWQGRIQLVGEEPHWPYERPGLSKAFLTDASPMQKTVLYPESAATAGIEYCADCRIEAIDLGAQEAVAGDGSRLPWQHLVLATGSRLRRLPIPGDEHVCYLRTLDDAHSIRAHARTGARFAIFGAGVIGLELAASLRSIGCEVVVVAPDLAPLARVLPPVIGKALQSLHEQHGVRFRLGVKPLSLHRNAADADAVSPHGSSAFTAILDDSGSLEIDACIAGVGVRPAGELARACGLAGSDGVLVDGAGISSDPRVRAIGEVAEFLHPIAGRVVTLDNWTHACRHADHVAARMAGKLPGEYQPVPWFWSDQFGLNLQVAGFPSPGLAWEEAESRPAGRLWLGRDPQGFEVAAVGFDAGRAIRRFIKDQTSAISPRTPL